MSCSSWVSLPLLFVFSVLSALHLLSAPPLAHFFDIVHGSRHNVFMTEYRSLFMMQWLALLESKGWDPETVERLPYAEKHLYNVVL